jgi:pimeloyl-ACP methyl ester carboxylesterase
MKFRFSLRLFFRVLSYGVSVLLIAWIIAVQAGCMTMRTSDRDWRLRLAGTGQKLIPQFIDVTDTGGRRIHAIGIAATDSLPLVVLVHGSPGSADAFFNYLSDTALSTRARIVTLDRPGFGYTQGFGRAEPSQAAQADAVRAVVDRLAPQQKVLLVGHSLGGPVIARFAMDYPERTAGLVIVAGSIDPDLEEHPWWQAAIDPPPLKWLIPKSLWASNREIKFLEKELRDMLPGWNRITCPVKVLHAADDRLVPAENAHFARRMLVNSAGLDIQILPDGDHFILWNRYERVRDAILDMVSRENGKNR